MSKVTSSARGEDCTIRLPGVCSFNPDETVFAHIAGIRFGHGTAIKTKLGAYACYRCHLVLDGAKRPKGMTLQDVKLAHFEGMAETLIKLDKKGIVKL